MISQYMNESPIVGVSKKDYEGIQVYKKALGFPYNKEPQIIDLDNIQELSGMAGGGQPGEESRMSD